MSTPEATPGQLEAEWQAAQGETFAEETAKQARKQADRPGVTIKGGSDGGETELISPLSTAIQSPEGLLLQHGMDPEEWEIIEVKAGRWESAAKSRLTEDWITTDLHQIRIRVRPKKPPVWIVPAAETSAIWTPKPHIPAKGRTRLTLVTTDLQVPFHDPKLHELTLHLAERIKPDAWVDLGDVLDLPMFSRWRQKPEFKATFNESITVGGKLFLERRQAVGPDCACSVLWGNHDTRLRNWLLEHAEALFDVKRAQLGFADDERSVLELDYLLRLDDSGWKKARSPWGEYPYECIWIAPGLAGVHGVHVRKGAGNSVRQEIVERDHCVPLDTEILTHRGWKRHDEVVVGDLTVGFNSKTGRNEWTPVREIMHFDDAPLGIIGNHQWQATATPNHRWVAGRARRHGANGGFRPRSFEHGFLTTAEAAASQGDSRLVLSAPLAAGRRVPLTLDEIRIIAWAYTDGSVNIRRDPSSETVQPLKMEVKLYQGKPAFVEEIQRLLADVKHSEHVKEPLPGRHYGIHTFRLATAYARELRERAGLFEGTLSDFVLKLDADGLHAFLDAAWQAEGTTNGGRNLAQNRGSTYDALLLATYLNGYLPSVTRNSGRDNWSIHQGRPTAKVPSLTYQAVDRAPVWCVRTDLETWTMRQGDMVCLTGNSVIQGHVNKLAIYPYTRTSIQGKRTVWGIECGPMCLVEGSLGFGGQTVDWNPSLVTITTFPDGSFLPEPAPYINGVLSYRGMRLGHAPNGSVWVEA
jgi:hypothetical protein